MGTGWCIDVETNIISQRVAVHPPVRRRPCRLTQYSFVHLYVFRRKRSSVLCQNCVTCSLKGCSIQRDLRGHGDAHLLLREVVEVDCIAAIDIRQARAPGAVKVQQALEIEDDRGCGRGLFDFAPVFSNDLPADDDGAAKHNT